MKGAFANVKGLLAKPATVMKEKRTKSGTGEQAAAEAGGGANSEKGASGAASVANGMSRGNSHRVAEKPSTKHSFSVSGAKFVVDVRYVLIKPLGTGAYGVVCSAKDSENTNRNVAIKKIVDAFDDVTDLKRILREIRLMRALDHENLLGLVDLDRPATYAQFTDIYMVTELMDTDLAKLLSRKERLLDDQCKFFVYQMVRAMKYLHSAHVLHRDLKPANVLVNANCDLKICDFGLARYLDPEERGEKTDYVVTRWYRAPELILSHHYTNGIDMWSIGCIMGEMLTGRVLFPGKDVKNQLELICDITGKPTSDDIWYVTSKRALKFLQDLPDKPKRPFSEIFPRVKDQQALDLIARMLEFNPATRITAVEALSHPYLEDYHDPEDEPLAPENLLDNTIEPDSVKKLNKEELRQMLWKEVLAFHPDAKGPSPRTSASTGSAAPPNGPAQVLTPETSLKRGGSKKPRTKS